MHAAEKQLRRLIALDAALGTPEGVRRAEFAEANGIDGRTVSRLLDTIQAVGLEINSVRIDQTDGVSYYVYQYVDRRRQLFAPGVRSR